MSGGKVTITKMGAGDTHEGPSAIREAVNPIAPYPSGPGIRGDTFVASGGGGKRGRRAVRRTTKTFPKGILRRTSRIIPSSNPSAPDGGSSKSRKHRLRLTTVKGSEKTRKNLHSRASKTDIKTIRADLEKRGIVAKDPKKKIPEKILRTLYEDSVGAGLLS
jgi:hypothetical protein